MDTTNVQGGSVCLKFFFFFFFPQLFFFPPPLPPQERGEHLRVRDPLETGVQTPLEVLRGAPRLLQAGAGKKGRRREREVLKLQLNRDFLPWDRV